MPQTGPRGPVARRMPARPVPSASLPDAPGLVELARSRPRWRRPRGAAASDLARRARARRSGRSPSISCPARSSSPSRSSSARRSALRSARGRSSGIASAPPLNARASAPFSLPLASAASSSARDTPIHAPRPGRLGQRRRAAPRPSGEIARRTQRVARAVLARQDAAALRRAVAARRRFSDVGALGAHCEESASAASSDAWLGAGLVFEPVRAGGHDDLVALLFAQAVLAEHAALVLGRWAVAAQRRAVGAASAGGGAAPRASWRSARRWRGRRDRRAS